MAEDDLSGADAGWTEDWMPQRTPSIYTKSWAPQGTAVRGEKQYLYNHAEISEKGFVTWDLEIFCNVGIAMP